MSYLLHQLRLAWPSIAAMWSVQGSFVVAELYHRGRL